MSQNAPTKETPAEKTVRLANLAKAQIDDIVAKVGKDTAYFGKPTIELSIQEGALHTVSVTEHRSHR